MLIAVVLIVLVGMPALAAPNKNESPARKDQSSTFDFYERKAGIVNPYRAREHGDISIEWTNPPDGQRDFYAAINIPYTYLQSDPRWRENLMKSRMRSIWTDGCTLTSACMVFNAYGAYSDPGVFNAQMDDGACPFNWDVAPSRAGLSHVRYDLTSPYKKLRYEELGANEWYNMAWAIQLGDAPIVEFTKPDGNNHWVVVYSVNGLFSLKNSYRILDPAYGERPMTDLTNQGWYITSLVIYEPT